MKKIILVALVALVAMSATPVEKPALNYGTYGVCDCNDTASAPWKIELSINEDATFHYLDNSNPDKKIDLKGTWTLKGKTIKLLNYQSDFAIHNSWTIVCLKSRKGLNFERLCLIKPCQ